MPLVTYKLDFCLEICSEEISPSEQISRLMHALNAVVWLLSTVKAKYKMPLFKGLSMMNTYILDAGPFFWLGVYDGKNQMLPLRAFIKIKPTNLSECITRKILSQLLIFNHSMCFKGLTLNISLSRLLLATNMSQIRIETRLKSLSVSRRRERNYIIYNTY